ncbi:MAG: hypothetical protein P4L46_15350 [Fimbriimonas sp.]|nr:hypothetical protein [Fimbriimonas sp.]
MRALVLTAITVSSAIACGQDLGTKVTYSTRAARASVVVKELGELAKVKLATSPQTEGEILIVSVRDQSLSDIMSRIASVTSGEWKPEGGTYRLVADNKRRNLEAKERHAKRLSSLQADLKKFEDNANKQLEKLNKLATAKPAKKPGDKSVADKPIATTTPGTPAPVDPALAALRQKLSLSTQFNMLSLIKGVDPNLLCEMTRRERLVFSTSPNRMQRSLGGDAPALVDSIIQAHNELVSRIPPAPAPDLSDLGTEAASYVLKMRRMRTSIVADAAKAVLTVKPLEFDSEATFNLRIYNREGVVVLTARANLSGFGRNKYGDDADDGPERPTTEKETPIQYAEDSKALIAATSGKEASLGTVRLDPAVRIKIFAPDRFDPLAFADTDEILAYAKSLGKPLIADLPDSYGGLGSQSIETLESVSSRIKAGDSIERVPDRDFTVLRPADPCSAREERLNRQALAELMHVVLQKGVPSLDAIANFAARTPYPGIEGMVSNYFNFFIPGFGMTGPDFSYLWDMLRFYADLSPQSRELLRNGGRLAFSSLTADQHEALNSMLFGSSPDLAWESKVNVEDKLMQELYGGSLNEMGMDYHDDPTEVAPNGVPADGFVDMKAQVESFAFPLDIEGAPCLASLEVLGPTELAIIKMSRDPEVNSDAQQIAPHLNHMKLGTKATLSFTFHVAPQIVLAHSLSDCRLLESGGLFAEENLPDAFMKQIAERLAKIKAYQASNEGGNIVGSGQTIHP